MMQSARFALPAAAPNLQPLHPAEVDVRTALGFGGHTIEAVYADGDSFREWGEHRAGEPRHVTVAFASTEDTAYEQAEAMYVTLLASRLVDPDADCAGPSDHSPLSWAVTSAHIWSASLLHDGRDKTCAADWADHDRACVSQGTGTIAVIDTIQA